MRRPRNDPAQYEDLADHWWRPAGAFAALHWLAEARASVIPPPERAGSLLLDLGCGGGLMGPHVRGHRHVGIDLSPSALAQARSHGVTPIRGNVLRLPVRDACADVVLAGELLEHVTDLPTAVAETARVLRPGGSVVIDTINHTWWSKLSIVLIGEHMPGGPPPRIHDASLFVAPRRLQRLFARHGITLRFRGLRFSVPDYLRYVLVDRGRSVRMLPTRSLSGVYQAVGRKEAA